MGLLAGWPHSTGAMYLAINFLQRGVRYLQRNILCYAVLPGPSEPSLEQLNHILESLIAEVVQLQQGKILTLDLPISRASNWPIHRHFHGHI
jgi:hypothetical protein